jgi:hypothetical protein
MQNSRAFEDVGKSEDLFYSDPDNCKVEKIPVQYNTRFTQNLSNLSAGTSVFIIPPGNGLKMPVLVLGYLATNPAMIAQAAAQTAALERGWGYSAIAQISFRIGGSSQYFLTGSQLLARNIRMVRTQNQADSILQLGGNQVVTAGDYGVSQYAYIPLSIWASPGEDGLNVPLPADCLAQQVQLTVQINPPNSWWLNNGVAAVGTNVPTAFDVGYFQQEQLEMLDRGMSITNHVDLNTHELTMPLPTFDQQELTVPIAAGGGAQQITLTGFRAGQVKKIQMFLTKNTDTINPLRFYAPAAVTILYAGTIYSQYNDGTSQIWNLVDGTKPAAVNQSALSLAAGVFTSAGVLSTYAELPFGSASGDDYSASVLTHGKEILNGLVNAVVTPPTNDAYTCHVVYVYQCTAVFSRSSCELRF